MVSGRPNLVSAPGSESKSQSQSKSLREPIKSLRKVYWVVVVGGCQTKFNVSSRLRVNVTNTE